MCEAVPAKKPAQPPRDIYASSSLGLKAQRAAVEYANGDVCAVAQLCATSVLDVFRQTYAEHHSRVFVACGGGFNGLVGALFALALKKIEYEPSVFWIEEAVSPPLRKSFQKWKLEAASWKIPVYDFAPSTASYFFDVTVDALLGMGFDGEDIRPVYWGIFKTLLTGGLPLLSIDVPSGWDLDKGPRDIDVAADSFLKPEVLVSLGVPKFGAKMFSGSYHFLGGRHLPPGWVDSQGIRSLVYPGKDANCCLISSTPFPSKSNNGEIYGNPGKFLGTLFTPNPRRRWVSDQEIEDNADLWDEID